MPIVEFENASEARLVAEQLPESLINEEQVYCKDGRALKTAVALAGIKEYKVSDNYCTLRFPSEEREYTGDNPSVYVRCISAYNNGFLHGLWLDAARDVAEVREDINWMLSWSPVVYQETCQEWAIHDYEDFGGYSVSETPELEILSKVAQGIVEYGEAFSEYLDRYCIDSRTDWEQVYDNFSCDYLGHYNSEVEFVEENQELYCFSEMEEKFPFLAMYIDWESIARDVFINDYYSIGASEGGVHVFRYH